MEQMMDQGAQEAAPAEQGQGGGGDVGEFVQNLGQGIATLGELVSKTEGAPPEAGQLIQGIMQQFQQLVQVMAGEAAPAEEPQGQGRAQAVPVNQPEGTPVGM